MQILQISENGKMLKNAPTVAIGGVDTAENGPSKVRQVASKIRRNVGAFTTILSRITASSGQ